MKPEILKQSFVIAHLTKYRDQLEKFGVKSLALFGSTARDEATIDSDLDFLVEFDTELTFDIYMDFKFFLEELFNRRVDLVIKEDLKPQIRENILKQAIYVP
ncbi:DNA polymerase beta domain protein region [[Synechococcus] sp. NIES-970]|nr:DNA polymerase beta domain protein region [[Synechococcus] sp. NIES-970]